MSEPMSDALFGNDGTRPPEPIAGPSTGPGRESWQSAPELPPMWLPPAPDQSALREAIAAALGEDPDLPAEAVDQAPAAAPAPQPAGQPTVPDAKAPDAKAPDAKVPDVDVAAPPHSTTTGTPTGRPATTEAGDRSPPRQPPVSALISPAPSQPRRPGGLRYRPPMAGESRASLPEADLRRRIRRERVDLPLRTGSNGGATIFFLAMLIIMGLLVYFIVAGFVDSLSRFLP